jgi:CBS domain containing-hemolysin-like protein
MEALPIFLDRLLNPVAAVVISVTAILLFGEIIPQAVCKRYGLQVRLLRVTTTACTFRHNVKTLAIL